MEIPLEGLGCSHYRRKCQLIAPCCQKTYTCRFCHDEHEDHAMNRKEVTRIQCLRCSEQQEVRDVCSRCGIVFGNYFCSVCKLFDDEDKKQYHCEGCGICRVGGREKFFHCNTCDMCLPIKLQNSHKCIEKVSRSNCPVCLEDLHTSRVPSHIPPCGHLIHRNCFEEMLKTGNYACPLCALSMVNMKNVWKHFDQEVEATPMPPEYASRQVMILCRDCHKENLVRFHVVGLKCAECGSYNTCQTKGSPHSDDDETSTYSSSDKEDSDDDNDQLSEVKSSEPLVEQDAFLN